jgi:hypothetical protein
MMMGMALRLCQKLELNTCKVEHDYFSTFAGVSKFHVNGTEQERKRYLFFKIEFGMPH